MKKSLLMIGSALMLSFSDNSMQAQALNGIYSIHAGQATAGSNFQSFTDLATALNTNGVSGPVTIDVVTGTGPYNEQVLFGQITGASNANRIVINGNGELIQFNSTNAAQKYVIGLNGADYFTFNELNVYGGGTNAWPCLLYNNANYNLFSSCSFSVLPNVTSTNQIPVVMTCNAVGSSLTNSGTNPGEYNVWKNCTTYSGYHGFAIYGISSSPFTNGNQIIGCTVLEFYASGILFNQNSRNSLVKGNNISRPTRTGFTTSYGINIQYCDATVVEENYIHNMFDNAQANTSTFYGILFNYNNNSFNWGFMNRAYLCYIRNNIISDIKHNGQDNGIQSLYLDGYIYNNTVSLDNTNSTAGATYGIYAYTQQGIEMDVTDNIVSITRGGTGTKYCFYNGGGVTGGMVIENNDFYINSAGGTNYTGYWTANATTLAQLQTQGIMTVGYSVNPNYVNLAGQDYHPSNVAINNKANIKGLVFDCFGAIRNQQTPDIGALEFLTPNCNGIPNNFVTGGHYTLCPGETADLGIGIFNSDAGFTYQWQISTQSQVGPFSNINGATGIFYTTPPITQNVWYSVVITCTNPGGGVSTPVSTLIVGGPVTSNVEYLEDFENIGKVNRLPNCSWYSPVIGGAAKTFISPQTGNRLPKSGTSFATFEAGNGGVNYYYSNGINLHPGITYSASLWFQTDFSGGTNWNDLSILIGSAQSPNGLVPVASTNGPAVSPIYKPLSNVFTVASSGVYYVAVRATASSGSAQFLSWDDLRINVPCNLNPVNVSISGTSTACSGVAVNLSATGANSFTWNTGVSQPVISVTPAVTSTYVVTGSNLNTGCTGNAVHVLNVKPSPVISGFAVPSTICQGKSTNLNASGGVSYTWSSGQFGNPVNASPAATTIYTVIGSGSNGCTGKSTAIVIVNAVPVVNTIGSSQFICQGEPATLVASGAKTYVWTNNTSGVMYQGSNVTTLPLQLGQVTFTATGSDDNGCNGLALAVVNVEECLSINKNMTNGHGVNIYPNPSNGVFTIEAGDQDAVVEISDLSGRVILSAPVLSGGKVMADISDLSSGIYLAKISTVHHTDVLKIVIE